MLLQAAASRPRDYGNLGFPPIFTLVTRLLVVVSKARRREDFGCYTSNNFAAGLGPPLLSGRYQNCNVTYKPRQFNVTVEIDSPQLIML